MKKIGIIGAMELEVETLKSKMNVVKTTKKANMEFFEGTLNGVEVVIVRSGIGKVNAGICTQILADLFDVTHIIIPVSQVLWTHRSISGISLFPQMSFSMTWMCVYLVIH